MHSRRLLSAACLMLPFAASAGSFDFAPPSVQVAPGATAPELVLRFTGDGKSVGAQVDYAFASELVPSLEARAGSCMRIGNQIRALLVDSELEPWPATPTAVCAVRFAAPQNAALGPRDLVPVAGSSLCADAGGDALKDCVAVPAPGALVVALPDALFQDDFEAPFAP